MFFLEIGTQRQYFTRHTCCSSRLDCVLLRVVAVVKEVVVATQLSLSWVEANNAGVTALFINTNSEV